MEWRYRWVLVAGLVFCFLSGPAESYEYNVVNLGTIGSNGSRAYGINDNGQVVGGLRDSGGNYVGAFFWTAGTGMQELTSSGGPTRAWDINNAGQIVGVASDRPALWETRTGGPTDIGTLGGPTGTAFRISESGHIVGWADLPYNTDLASSVYHAFVYENETITDLGTLNSVNSQYDYGYSLSYDINSSGRIVGIAHTDTFALNAALWDVTGTEPVITDLGTHPDHPGSEGYASVINEKGTIVGHGYVAAEGGSYPMQWNESTGTWVPIPMLASFPYGEFYDINESDQMVGVGWDSDGTEHAVLYDTQGSAEDLNDLIPGGSGWELSFANGINEKGQIVGLGQFNGEERAFLLEPVPLPPSISMLSLGLLGIIAFGRKYIRS